MKPLYSKAIIHVFILFNFISINSFSQLQRWILGSSCFNSSNTTPNTTAAGLLKFYEMDFTSGTPTFSSRVLGTSITSIVSAGTYEAINNGLDSAGNIAFYTFASCPSPYTTTSSDTIYFVSFNSTTAKDEVFAKIAPSGGGASSVRNMEVVKKPGVPGQYYVIYKTACKNNQPNDFIRYVTVNTINKTVSSPITISTANLNEGMAISRLDCLSNSRWLFFVKYISGNLEVYRAAISGSGIGTPTLASTIVITGNTIGGQGDIEISPSGDKLAIANFTTNSINEDIIVMDLDLATGVVSNQRWINNPNDYIFSIEFSPDGQRLYAMRSGTSAITNEMYNVAVSTINYTILASDLVNAGLSAGTINAEIGYNNYLYYNTKNYNTSLSYITNPNSNAASNIVLQTLPNSFGLGNAVGITQPDQNDGDVSCSGIGIEEKRFDTELKINIYPNPTGSTLNIDFKESNLVNVNIVTLIITDISGKVVKTQNLKASENKISTDVYDLSKGIYLIKCISLDQIIGYGKILIE